MKKRNLYFYLFIDNYLYDNGKIVKNNDECYKIISKYKIPKFLTNVKVVRQTLTEADNNLIFVGYDKNDKLQYFYGDEYVKFRKKNKLKSFLKIDSKRDIINEFLDKNTINFKNITHNSLLAILLQLEFKFYIRTGRKKYLDINKTTGILTLKKKNIVVNDDDIFIVFYGKKGIFHKFIISKVLDSYLFKTISYLYKNIKNDDDYLFSLNGKFIGESKFYKVLRTLGITLKEIRTYGANVVLIREMWKFLNTVDNDINKISTGKMLKNIINKTAEIIGHSKSISKKSYIIDVLIDNNCLNDIIINFNSDFLKFYKYVVNKLRQYE